MPKPRAGNRGFDVTQNHPWLHGHMDRYSIWLVNGRVNLLVEGCERMKNSEALI
jgi:hypothetical protein